MAAKLDRAPAAKLCRMEPAAWAAARRTGRRGGRSRRASDPAKTRRDARRAGPAGRGQAVGGGCATGHRRAAARGGGRAGGRGHRSPPGQAQRASAGHRRAGDGEAGADGGARAELRRAGDQAGRDAGAEDAEAQHGERGEHDGQRLLDGRLAAGVGLRELREEAGADADDDGQHHHLHAGGDDVAEHLLGEEGGLVEEREGNEDEAGERRQLELDQRDEELHRQDEEGDQHQDPRDHQHRDLDEVREEAGEAHHLARRVEQRLTGVEPDLGELARPQEVGGRDRRAARLQAEAGEAVEDDGREIVEVGDDEGEEADVEGLLHQALEDVLVGAPGPEQARERDVDDDQRGREIADLALDQAEAGIDVGGEGVEEGVDDADVVHRASPLEGVAGAAAPGGVCGGSGRAGLPKKRWRFSSQTATQCGSSASWGPSALQRRSSAERSSDAGLRWSEASRRRAAEWRRLIATRPR